MLDDAVFTLRHGAEAIADAAGELGSRTLDCDALIDLIGACQEVSNALAAIQALALAQVAASDNDRQEDGTVIESPRPLGYQREDASSLVCGVLGCSDRTAGHRVDEAITLVTQGPVLLEQMGRGRLDAWRATCVLRELSETTPPVRAAVLASVVETLSDALPTSAPGVLTRVTRAHLTRLDADALTRRVKSARERRGLTSCAGEPGMRTWLANLPTDTACYAWAAVTNAAHQYLAEGRATTMDQARADAMLDLILGHTTGTMTLTLAVPAGAMTLSDTDGYVPVTGTSGASEPALLAAAHLRELFGLGAKGNPTHFHEPGGSARPGHEAVGGIASLAGIARRVRVIECDPVTGAALTRPTAVGAKQINHPVASDKYRVPASLKDFIAARDGRCRFPGCTTAVRYGDKDHVIPWPIGPTAAANLIHLCRRHHRVKQRPGWHVTLDPDGTTTWRDPTGGTRTSTPTDHLGLWGEPAPPSATATTAPRSHDAESSPHDALASEAQDPLATTMTRATTTPATMTAWPTDAIGVGELGEFLPDAPPADHPSPTDAPEETIEPWDGRAVLSKRADRELGRKINAELAERNRRRIRPPKVTPTPRPAPLSALELALDRRLPHGHVAALMTVRAARASRLSTSDAQRPSGAIEW